ncbi:TRAP transporter small permease [Marispirochaeta sp.]|jgi:TRAP-type transport system small permease protein|uniref:TRAP transporter small permease n=1 Tax=Marispirochaeta sp. TaxID=2038653 RepID=UPI0029C9304B|nr:TRAP transporter small permease [Marispirochaeta sp.]
MTFRETMLKFIQSARRGLHFAIILLFSAMFIVVLVNVIMRFVFNNPVASSGELARYLFVSITYLGAIITFRENAHIGLDIIVENFPKKAKTVVYIFDRLLVAVFLIVFTYVSFKMAMLNIETKSSAMFISMAIPYMALPISGAGMLIEMIIGLTGIDKPGQESI